METVTTNYTTMFKAIHTTFALTSHITVFQCWKISSVYNRKAEPHFFSTMKVISVFQSLAESVLSFLCFCLTSHRLLPRLAESRVDFFFLALFVLWHPCPDETMWEEEKPSEKTREKDRNAVRQLSLSLCFQHTALGLQLCTLNTTKSD